MTLKKLFKSFIIAVKGLTTVWEEEVSFRSQSMVATVIILGAFYFNFSFIEMALIVLGIIIVFASEIINTVIENLCNKVEPGLDNHIGKIKDMSAAFVLISTLGAFSIGLIVLVHHFLGVKF